MGIYHGIEYPKIGSRDTVRESIIWVEARWRHAKGLQKVTHRLTDFYLVSIVMNTLGDNACGNLTIDIKQLVIDVLLLGILSLFVFFRSLDIDNCLLDYGRKSRDNLLPLRLLPMKNWMIFVHGCFVLLWNALNNLFLLFLDFSNYNTFILDAENLIDQLVSH